MKINLKRFLIIKKDNFLAKPIIQILKSDLVSVKDDINICDARKKEDGYAEVIDASLNLIKDHAPEKYERVKNHVSWLVNSIFPDKYGGRYQKITKCCYLNFVNYSEDQKLVSAYYAGIIVHEATHGLLHSIGIEPNKKNRVRIEKICRKEENRFYAKIEHTYPDYDGLLINEFDPKAWDGMWKAPKWKQFFQGYQRIKEDEND